MPTFHPVTNPSGRTAADIVIDNLPSVALAEVALLPNERAIYFVRDTNQEVLYIGKADSLRSRWIKHHRASQLSLYEDVRIYWLAIPEPIASVLGPWETYYIGVFNPVLNGTKVVPPSQSSMRVYTTIASPLVQDMINNYVASGRAASKSDAIAQMLLELHDLRGKYDALLDRMVIQSLQPA